VSCISTKHHLQPHVHTLLDALIVCFDDDSWPVRDAACVACARFIANACLECDTRLRYFDVLAPKLWMQLQDCIPDVRQVCGWGCVNDSRTIFVLIGCSNKLRTNRACVC
jgi:hypothetical protein